jgi:hypothetical protein
MSYTPLSALDLIIWLQHTNIDRLYAVWSTINPHSYVISMVNKGTYAEAANTLKMPTHLYDHFVVATPPTG